MGRARPEVGSRCRVCSGPRAGRLRRALTGKGRSKRRRTRSCRGPRGPAPFSLSCPTTLHRQVPRKSLSPSAGCGWAFCCLQEEESCLIVTGQWATGVTAQESLLMDVPDMQTGWTARAGSVRGRPRRSLLCSRRTAGPDHQHPSLPFPPPPPALPLLPGIHVGARRSGPMRMGGGPRRPRGRKGKESGVLRTLTSPHRLLPGFAGGRGNKRPSWGSHCNLGRPSHAAEPDPSLSFCGWGCSHSERIQSLHGAQRAFHVSTQLFLLCSFLGTYY